VAGINSLHQEINMRHTLSASVNQVVRYWLLPLLTETIEHEDQMTAILLALISNTAKLLIVMQVLSD